MADESLLEIYLNDISESISGIRAAIKKVGRAETASDKKKNAGKAQTQIEECENSLKIFESELKQCTGEDRKKYEKQFSKFQDKLATAKSDLRDALNSDSGSAGASSDRDSKPVQQTPGAPEERSGGKSSKSRQNQKEELLAAPPSAAAAQDDPAPQDGGNKKSNKKKSTSAKSPSAESEVSIEMQDHMMEEEMPQPVPVGELRKAKRGDVKIMDEIHDIQDETNQALDRMIMLNEQTINIAAETAAKLKEQTEKIVSIQRNLDDLGSETKRARKELNSFMRQLAKDKLFMIILIIVIFLAFCGLIAYIIVRFVKPDLLDPANIWNAIISGGGGGGGGAATNTTKSAFLPSLQ